MMMTIRGIVSMYTHAARDEVLRQDRVNQASLHAYTNGVDEVTREPAKYCDTLCSALSVSAGQL